MKKSKFVIQDWASNYLQHNGKFNFSAYGANKGTPMEFDSYDYAWDFIFENYKEDEAFNDCFVTEL